MKRKEVISDLASRRYDQVNGFVAELEESLVDYIRKYGEDGAIEFIEAPRIYTVLHRWGETESVRLLGMKVSEGGNLIVIDEDGYEHSRDRWSLDTLFDICYCVDCWPTEENV